MTKTIYHEIRADNEETIREQFMHWLTAALTLTAMSVMFAILLVPILSGWIG